MVGLQVGRRVGPCPACNATRRGRADPRPPIGLRPDQRGWRCHACGAQGDGLDLAAWVVRGSRLRDLNNEGCRAVVGALGAYETGDMPIFSDIGFPPLPSSRPHLDGLKATWDGAHPVTSDEGAVNWLRGRGLDPERIVDLDLARALHAEPPRWARCLGLGWLQGWRLLLPAYDAEGVLRSLRGRWVSTSFPPENTKVVSPRGKLGQHPLRTRCQHRAAKVDLQNGEFRLLLPSRFRRGGLRGKLRPHPLRLGVGRCVPPLSYGHVMGHLRGERSSSRSGQHARRRPHGERPEGLIAQAIDRHHAAALAHVDHPSVQPVAGASLDALAARPANRSAEDAGRYRTPSGRRHSGGLGSDPGPKHGRPGGQPEGARGSGERRLLRSRREAPGQRKPGRNGQGVEPALAPLRVPTCLPRDT